MAESEHFDDAFAYAFNEWKQSDYGCQHPPVGAVDFHRGPDGVWRLPKVWVAGDTLYFGIDLAQPGSDRTAHWSFTR